MKGKYKLTRFARFVIFLALISPACYLAGIHFQNDLDILDLKDKLITTWSVDSDSDQSEIKLEEAEELQEELEEDIEDLQEEIQDLESELNDKILELKELRLEVT